MPKKRLGRDVLTQALKNLDDSDKRWTPLKKEDIKDEPLAHVIADLVSIWPPKDIRLESHWRTTHDMNPTDSEYMEMMAHSMEIRVIKRNLQDNEVTFAVDFQSNLKEYEDYNEAVYSHNKNWEDQGCPEDVFDPKTGEIKTINDTYVDPVLPVSKHHPISKSLFESKSNGKLAKAKPTLKRKTLVKLYYQANIKGDTFTLKIAAKDMKNTILYHKIFTGDDIAMLIRSSIQSLWGHPTIYNNEGPFLNGISMLIQGKKLKYCEGTPWISGHTPVIPKGTPSDITRISFRTGHILTAYVIPFLTIPAIIWLSIYCLLEAYGDNARTMSPLFFSGIGLILVTGYISLKLGGFFMDKEEEIKRLL